MTACIVKQFSTGPRLTGTCEGACEHYVECKPGHPSAAIGALPQGVPGGVQRQRFAARLRVAVVQGTRSVRRRRRAARRPEALARRQEAKRRRIRTRAAADRSRAVRSRIHAKRIKRPRAKGSGTVWTRAAADQLAGRSFPDSRQADQEAKSQGSGTVSTRAARGPFVPGFTPSGSRGQEPRLPDSFGRGPLAGRSFPDSRQADQEAKSQGSGTVWTRAARGPFVPGFTPSGSRGQEPKVPDRFGRGPLAGRSFPDSRQAD